jgi:hypothetical protein
MKKNQHYIPQFYLKNFQKSKLYVLFQNKIEVRNPKSIAKEKYFYRLTELRENEVKFLRGFIDTMDKNYKKMASTWINLYEYLFRMMSLINSSDDSDETQKMFKEMLINTDENLYSNIEDSNVNFISTIIKKEAIELADDEKSLFCFYISVQYFRTKRIKEATLRALGNARNERIHLYDDETKEFYNSLDFESIWMVLIKILASNMGFGISKLKKFDLLINNTTLPFITCDQPCINLVADGNYDKSAIVDDFVLYYPLSPKIALIMSEDYSLYVKNSKKITREEVTKLNNMIFNHSLEQVYSNDLETLKKYIQQWE